MIKYLWVHDCRIEVGGTWWLLSETDWEGEAKWISGEGVVVTPDWNAGYPVIQRRNDGRWVQYFRFEWQMPNEEIAA